MIHHRTRTFARFLPAAVLLPFAWGTPAGAAPGWKEHYEARKARFVAENAALADEPAQSRIVFAGDSLTEGFDLAAHFPGVPTANRGIVSDTAGLVGRPGRGLLHRMDESVFDCHPRCLFLLIGVNDLGDLARGGEPSLDEIEAGYRAVLAAIRDRTPDLPVYVQSCLPARAPYDHLNPLIDELNRRIERLAREFHHPFVDLRPLFRDDSGQLDESLTRDGLHINATGYKRWADRIRPLVQRHAPAPPAASDPDRTTASDE